MPTNRKPISRPMLRLGPIPPGVVYWLENCRSPHLSEAGWLELSPADIWQASNLHYARPTATGWTREDVRAEGFGDIVDQHIAAGRCPPDRRRPPAVRLLATK